MIEKNYYGKETDIIVQPKALGARLYWVCLKCNHFWFKGEAIAIPQPKLVCPKCGAKNE